MYFDGWEKSETKKISKDILWEYNTESPNWNWQKMKEIVVSRVIERGDENDYIAMFQLYNGFESVKNIIKTIPYLNNRDMNWCCIIFGLKKEELWSYKRMLSRKKLLNC